MEKIISAYLRRLNIPVSKNYCETLIASHPDYPSLLSVADSLERLGIDFQAVRGGLQNLESIGFPYILHFERHGGELIMIEDQEDLKARESDFEHWDGVILQAEPTETIADKQNHQWLADDRFVNTTLKVCLVCVALVLLLPSVQVLSWIQALLISTALVGSIAGYLLLAKEVGIHYQAVEAFCNTGTKANCDRLLKSEDAKFFGRITFSDAVMSYFAFQLIVLGVLIPFLEAATIFLLALSVVSLFTVPVVLYSLYYQGVVAKTWCRLCLVVDGLLIGQVTLFGYMLSEVLMQPVTVEGLPLFLFGALFVATGSSVLLIKHLLETANAARQAAISAGRIKYSPDVFTHLLSQSQRTDTTPFDQEIMLGSREAPVQITMAANLFCYPCKVGFEKACQILAAYPEKVNLSIRLLRSGDGNGRQPDSNRYILSYWIYNIYGKPDEQLKTRKLFRDWYESADMTRFMNNYPMDTCHEDQPLQDLETQYIDWFKEENITRTPTWFINGYELPSQYKIEDLMGMVPGLSDSFSRAMKLEKVQK